MDLVNDTIRQTLIDNAGFSEGSQGLVVRSIRILAHKVFKVLTTELGDKGIHEGMDNLDLIRVQGRLGVGWSHGRVSASSSLDIPKVESRA